MANLDNVFLGPSLVTISGAAGTLTFTNEDLGAFSTDGTSIVFTNDTIPVATDQTGTVPAKIFLAGQGATITTPLLEEDVRKLGVGLVGSVVTSERIDFGRAAGYNITDNWVFQMRITPLDTARKFWHFYRVVPAGEVTLAYNSTTPTILNLVWTALPDTTKTDGQRLGYSDDQP